MYVVFEAKGFQWVCDIGSKIKIPLLDKGVGEEITFDKVLLVKNEDVMIGHPYLEGAIIKGVVTGHSRYRKIIVYKYKRRKRYRRTIGHRQHYTEIEIKDVILKELAKEKEESKVKKVVKAKKESKVGKDIKEKKESKKKKVTKAKKEVKVKKDTKAKKESKAKKETKTKKDTKAKKESTKGKGRVVKKETKAKKETKTKKGSKEMKGGKEKKDKGKGG